MITWKKSSEGLPTEDGFYIVWSCRPFVAWFNSKDSIWEIKDLRVRAEAKVISHWAKADGPKEENVGEDRVDGC